MFQGGLLKNIVERTHEVLPDVSLLATEEWRHIQHHSHGGLFESIPLEDRRQKENEARQDPGHCRKRGGHGGGRGGVRAPRRRVDGGAQEQFDLVQGDSNYYAENLGNDDKILPMDADQADYILR